MIMFYCKGFFFLCINLQVYDFLVQNFGLDL